MSIEVNGYSAPDIPAGLTDTYRYVGIILANQGNSVIASIFATNEKAFVRKKEVLGDVSDNLLFISDTAVGTYYCMLGSMTEYASSGNMTAPAGTTMAIADDLDYGDVLFWTNYDVMEVSGYDDSGNAIVSDEVYFANCDVTYPERMSIESSWLAGIGEEYRRISDTFKRLTPNKLLTGFKNLPKTQDYQWLENSTMTGSVDVTVNSEKVDEIPECLKAVVTSVDLPNAVTVNVDVFNSCLNLTTANCPVVTVIDKSAFGECEKLTSINAPLVTTIRDFAFVRTAIQKADFPVLATIGNGVFRQTNLTTLILRKSDSIVDASAEPVGNFLYATPIHSGGGYIYVPLALIESYKVATGWSDYANQIRAIEDYPDICGTT